MAITGHCYCGEVAYEAQGDAMFKGQCHCRECQYISGGGPVVVMAVGGDAFRWTKGEPKDFTRSDIPNPVTRQFCPSCGTHLTTVSPSMGGAVMIKVGSLDDPSQFAGPEMVIYAGERQPWHLVPEGIPTFDGLPG